MKPDLNSRKGMLALADEVDTLPREGRQRVQIGPYSVMAFALPELSKRLRKAAPGASLKRKGVAQTPRPPVYKSENNPYRDEATRFYGTEVKALETLVRHLETQGEYMEESAVKRTKRAIAAFQQGHRAFKREMQEPYHDKKTRRWEKRTITGWELSGESASILARVVGRKATFVSDEELQKIRDAGFIVTH